MRGNFDITRLSDGTWEGRLDLLPAVGELNHLYHDAEKWLPPALRGFDGVYLAADGIRVKGHRAGIPFDVAVSVKAEAGAMMARVHIPFSRWQKIALAFAVTAVLVSRVPRRIVLRGRSK